MFISLKNKKKFVTLLVSCAQVVVMLFVPTSYALAERPTEAMVDTGARTTTASVTNNIPTFTEVVETVASAPGAVAGAIVGEVADITIGNVLKLIGRIFFEIAGKFLQMMALGLDMSIDKTIDSAMYKGLSSVQIGWTAIRDISNMFFIFALLYIAIKTILGMADGKTKTWVAHLIIAALLINFSLFATQVVIDAGNMLTVGFWSNIKTSQVVGGTSQGFAPVLMEGIRAQTVFNGGSGSNFDAAKIYFGGTLVMFIAGYVLLAGAIMMIIRTVTLVILMIVSPFAFLGFALPTGGGFAQKWLKKLIGATFVAPAFVMMLYLNMIIIRSVDMTQIGGPQGASFAPAFAGSVDNFGIIYNFLVVIILLLASLTVAHEVSNGVGDSAGGYAKKVLGYGGAAGFAGAAYGLRRTVGAGAERLKNSEAIQKAAQQTGLKGMMARTTIRTSNAAAKSSFDVRNAPGMNSASAKALGGLTGVSFGAAGGAGGERARSLSRNQEVIKRAEELFPNNPVAQQNYIRNATKPLPGMESQYDKKPSEFASKDEKTLAGKKKTVEEEIKKKDAKAKIESSKAEQKDIDDRLAANTITPEAAKAEGEVIALAVKDAMQKISVTDRAELAESHKDNAHFVNNLTKSDFATIHRMELEGKYTGVVGSVTEKAMVGDNFELQQYLTNPENKNRLTAVDQDAIMSNPKLMENYEKRMAQKEIGKSRTKDINRAHEEAIKENEDRNLLNSVGTV